MGAARNGPRLGHRGDRLHRGGHRPAGHRPEFRGVDHEPAVGGERVPVEPGGPAPARRSTGRPVRPPAGLRGRGGVVRAGVTGVFGGPQRHDADRGPRACRASEARCSPRDHSPSCRPRSSPRTALAPSAPGRGWVGSPPPSDHCSGAFSSRRCRGVWSSSSTSRSPSSWCTRRPRHVPETQGSHHHRETRRRRRRRGHLGTGGHHHGAHRGVRSGMGVSRGARRPRVGRGLPCHLRDPRAHRAPSAAPARDLPLPAVHRHQRGHLRRLRRARRSAVPAAGRPATRCRTIHRSKRASRSSRSPRSCWRSRPAPVHWRPGSGPGCRCRSAPCW